MRPSPPLQLDDLSSRLGLALLTDVRVYIVQHIYELFQDITALDNITSRYPRHVTNTYVYIRLENTFRSFVILKQDGLRR